MMNFNNFSKIVSQYNAIKNNPQEISKLLLNSGKISQDHYDAIKGMSSPSQIGSYLMNNGLLGQQQMQHLSQMVPQIQGMINAR